MNPLPSSANPSPQKDFAYYTLLGSQTATILTCCVFMYLPPTSPPAAGTFIFCLVLIAGGLTLGILSILHVKLDSPPRTHLWGIVTVVVDCVLLSVITLGFAHDLKKYHKTQQIIAGLYEENIDQIKTLSDLNKERTNLIRVDAGLREAATNLMVNLRESFNARTGITNVNPQAMAQIREQLNQASQVLPGDAGVMARVMAIHLDEVTQRSQSMQVSAQRVKSAHINLASDITSPDQIADRRKLVYDFLAANGAFANSISNTESSILTMLQSSNVSPAMIEIARGKLSSSRYQRELALQIRACDQQLGEYLLGILDLLEKDWGQWHSDPTNQTVNFDNEASRLAYTKQRQGIKETSATERSLQSQLVNGK